MNKKILIASVVPLIRVIPSLELLDYFFDKSMPIEPGMLVNIPFRNKNIQGVVWKLQSDTAVTKKIKSINSVSGYRFTSEQISLINWLHNETCAPLNVICKSFVPTNINVKNSINTQNTIQKLVLSPNLQSHEQVIVAWVRQLIVSTEKVLILCPSQAYVEVWMKHLPKDKTSILHSEVTVAGKKRILLDLQNKRFFITTHSGLFMPFPRLQRVIIDFADDPGYYAFDQAPRVDLRLVANYIATIHKAVLIGNARYINPVVAKLFNDTEVKQIGSTASVHIIDRSTEPSLNRKSILPTHLIERLANTRTLWLHNKLHEARSYLCKDCGTTLLCETCNEPLQVLEIKPVMLWCKRDRTKMIGPERCKVCHGSNFVQHGYGLLQTVREIQSLNKDVAVVSRDEHANLKSQHIVATTAIAAFTNQHFDAAVIVQPDGLIANGKFRTEESFLDLIALVKQFIPSIGNIYIPTFQPDHAAFQALIDIQGWLKKTQAERLKLLYPPEGTLIILQKRSRQKEISIHPVPDMKIPLHVIAQKINEQWILRCSNEIRRELIPFLQANLSPSWEAIIDPPNIVS